MRMPIAPAIRTQCILTLCLIAITCSPAFGKSRAANASKKTIYRGFTVATLDKKMLQAAIDDWGANQVRYMICPSWRARSLGAKTLQESWQKLLAKLPEGLDNAKELGLAVIIDLHQIPNDKPNRPYPKGRKKASRAWWLDKSNRRVMLDCWKQLARITAARRDQVIWLEIYNEPLDWKSFPRYPKLWPRWAQDGIDVVRKIDKHNPIVIASGPGSLCWGFKGFPLLKGRGGEIIYSLHAYEPHTYTHQGVSTEWPNAVDWPAGGVGRIEKMLSAAIRFQKRHKVRMHVGEFSVARWAPGAANYISDCIEVFEKHGWDWNYHAFREAGVWSLERGVQTALVRTMPDGTKKTFAGVARPGAKNIGYAKYGAPHGLKFTSVEGDGEMARVVRRGLKLNGTATKAKAQAKQRIRKILIIGNSLTSHGAAKYLDWSNNCGMAATSVDKDYVHQLYKIICEYQTGAKPKLKLGVIGREWMMVGHDHLVPTDADIIIVQLGDNYRGKANKEELQDTYATMLTALKGDRDVLIYCLGTWGGGGRDKFMKAAAKSQGAKFIPLRPLATPANCAGSEGHFTNAGVNWHPGNRGMKAIADTVWKVIKADLDAK